ncbi:3-deoxy-manno-octulosonate cytidylyltransferase [Pavlovales sp. CCMP2436]|nr:3-deoxy-manno-octulosonate cytidylyltransferase [Pavlovales sp. CCMP2436]|mmetsp:Transcript_12972/g.32927  ORF Transcript_12972/g.32927 Transcript_12972/m.32927 type:complete len:264 (-) Transcript_12972:205-996(-)
MRALVVIPSRLGSTRLPRKALADIHGQPMIARVVQAVLRSPGVGRVVVATDHESIAAAARAAGAEAVMTDPALPSGTDRVAVAVRALGDDSPIVVNVQGDEPLLPPLAISRVIGALGRDAAADMATLGSPLMHTDLLDLNRVKVVASPAMRALYFSRAPIGVSRAAIDEARASPERVREVALGVRTSWRHMGIYGFRREALFRYVGLPPSPLELVEGLEQLRALEAGMHIALAEIEAAHRGVDTLDDLLAVREEFLRAHVSAG